MAAIIASFLIVDVREADDITYARHVHEYLTTDNPIPKRVIEKADVKLAVISTNQLKRL